MSEEKGFLLVHRTPSGEIASHPYPYALLENAAAASARMITELGVADEESARLFAHALNLCPLGVIWGHPSGYDFRILEADLTADGALITPGLRVQINDMWRGVVRPDQFMTEGLTEPGGRFFDGWYLVRKEGEDAPYAKYNGERMSTKGVAR